MNTRDYLEAKSFDGYKFFGAHKKDRGYIFRLLAPNASEAYIIGDFNDWEKQAMRKYSTGVFSITIDQAKIGDSYQYILVNGNKEIKKIDPFAKSINYVEKSSVICDDSYKFKIKKTKTEVKNILQVFLGSLFKDKTKSTDEIFNSIIDHAKENNYDCLSLMPVNEYQNYKSMGYAPMNLFSYSNRYGDIISFKRFVDLAHKNKIKILLELDIGEFDPDSMGLINFDGSNIYNYDYDDILYNYYGSVNFGLSNDLARSYIQSAVDYYLKEYKIDGIYFPAIENVIYWQGDKNRGINKESFDFLSKLNTHIKESKALSLAGFSGEYDHDIDFDMVFDNKTKACVNMLKDEPIKRDYYKNFIIDLINKATSKNLLGFAFVDSFLNEASLAMKMYSDDKKLEQLKSLFTFLYTIKSPKMLFMGDDSGDLRTFSVYNEFDFKNFERNIVDFNTYYKDISDLFIKERSLSDKESEVSLLDIEGFSLYAYKRSFKNENLLVVINFTDIDYKIESPYDLEEIINTEDLKYKGIGNINGSLSKGESINIMPFGSAIFRIK
ncbi:MAG: glycogen-branching protein [Anaerococcus prevotii]|nr:glycogen-branching protein [Anaerococcus prevotii]